MSPCEMAWHQTQQAVQACVQAEMHTLPDSWDAEAGISRT